MEKASLFDSKFTVDIRNQKREELKDKLDLEAVTTVEVDVIKNHLMKAEIQLQPSGASFTIFSDEPHHFGGEASAPFMFGYFVAGMLLCETAQYIWNAAELGLTDKIYGLKMKIEGGFPLAPLFGLDDDKNTALSGMKVVAHIESDATAGEIERLARQAAKRCPAHQSLTERVPYTNKVVLNGKEIAEFSS